MLVVENVSIQFGAKTLFKNVNLSFSKGNCYGIIGANGAGKSTFLQVLSKEREPNSGNVIYSAKERLSTLKQDHNQYNDKTVIETVLLGYPELIALEEEKNAIYMKEDFTDEDGLRAGELENKYMEMGGYESDANARSLLNSLGIDNSKQDLLMKDLDYKDKFKVLLAQALFGNPDILILDEPTNELDIKATRWLENFLYNFENIVIVVSHDRYFLNKVCTRILDIDYGKISLFVGNYDFWYSSSQLILAQSKADNLKKEVRIKQLEEFIARFSANASKSKQATSRKKELEKITLDDLKPSSRRYPFIDWKVEKEVGNIVLDVENLSKGELFNNLNFSIHKGDKVAFISKSTKALTALFDVLAGVDKDYTGTFKYGVTITNEYLPQNNNSYFDGHNENLIEWIEPFSKEKNPSVLRGWLGRMLFSGDETLKPAKVLSGGEKVRMMLSKTMINPCNLIILDDPTNHLDLESITSLNKAMNNFKGVILFSSHDHELLQTVANRIIYIDKNVVLDKQITYDEFLDLDLLD